MQTNPRVLTFLSSFVCAVACGDANESEPASVSASVSELKIGSNATPVVGGKKSAPCAWPSTVDVAGCTATLIHSRVVTTAAHCLGRGGTARVTFTDGEGLPGSFTLMGQCTAGARGGRGGVGPRDWAYCVLPEDERVKKIPITPPLVGCEAERYLKAGNTAWIVGFGATGGNANDYGVKREVEVTINSVEDGIIDVGDRQAGACYGDSGGPLYIKITDGIHDWGWRVAGSTSGAGGPCDCTCSTVYTDVRSHVQAIEENEELDVTPCTDAEGNWAPGPDCKDLITHPAAAMGTYPSCTVQRTTEPIASCGAPMEGAGAAGSAAAGSGAAGAAGAVAVGGGAGVGPAGSGAAGDGARVAAGSGGTSSGVAGVGGASAAGNVATVGAAAAGSALGATVGAAGVGASAGQAAVGSAGVTGSQTNATTAAGSAAAPVTQPRYEEKSGGCQAAQVSASQSYAFGWLSALLLGLSARCLRSRQRHRR